MYFEEDWVPLSALQHYVFCPRQCALNYIEKVWVENFLTAAGRLLHEKTEEYFREKRKNVVHEFGVELSSNQYGVFGQADVVRYEFKSENKKQLKNVSPIEYKRGKKKKDKSDEIQLCAQGFCLEEMTGLVIEYGYLFYFSDRKKIEIVLSEDLRALTTTCIEEIHRLYSDGIVPQAEYKPGCESCSMKDVCFPKSAGRSKSVQRYISQRLKERDRE